MPNIQSLKGNNPFSGKFIRVSQNLFLVSQRKKNLSLGMNSSIVSHRFSGPRDIVQEPDQK